MAADPPQPDRKTYNTQIGNYTEEAGHIYVSDTVRREDLVVPAEFSKTGRDENLRFNPNTVIYTDQDYHAGETLEKSFPDSQDVTSAYLNNISLIASFADAVGRPDGLRLARNTLSKVGEGAAAMQVSSQGNGWLQLSSQDSAAYLVDFIGVERNKLNLTEGQIKAWAPSVAAHELYHLKYPKQNNQTVLEREIEADFGSLRDYFNSDYQTFVNDVQALRSLNFLNGADGRDDHATHIWAEEYSERMPTRDEVNQIELAPLSILKTMDKKIADASTDTQRSLVSSMLEDPAQRYGALKALREQGAFDEIPYGNEFVDKYISAAERRYTPEYLSESNVDKFRELLKAQQPEPSKSLQNSSMTLAVGPTASVSSFVP